MSAVISCLLALRDRFGSHVGEGFHCSLEEKGRMHSMEFPIRENGHGSRNSESVEESKQMKSQLLKVPKGSAASGEFLYQSFQVRQFLKKLQW
jgi:kinesin family member C2/C3